MSEWRYEIEYDCDIRTLPPEIAAECTNTSDVAERAVKHWVDKLTYETWVDEVDVRVYRDDEMCGVFRVSIERSWHYSAKELNT